MTWIAADRKASHARTRAWGKVAIKIVAWVSLVLPLSLGISTTWAAPLATPTYTVNSDADVHGYNGLCQISALDKTCTLRAAIEAANQLSGGAPRSSCRRCRQTTCIC